MYYLRRKGKEKLKLLRPLLDFVNVRKSFFATFTWDPINLTANAGIIVPDFFADKMIFMLLEFKLGFVHMEVWIHFQSYSYVLTLVCKIYLLQLTLFIVKYIGSNLYLNHFLPPDVILYRKWLLQKPKWKMREIFSSFFMKQRRNLFYSSYLC